MTYTPNANGPMVEAFQKLDVDQQLALFWYVYTEMGDSITPAAPGASTVSPQIAQSLYDQVEKMTTEEQLQLQRDLIGHQNSLIAREYGSMSDTTKLLFWYLLAQGMQKQAIVPFPHDYKLVSEAETLFSDIKALDFGEQITLFRDIVSPMGVDPSEVSHDKETGL
ncbi:MAG: Orange carotenoid protein [Kaiparowitsia implicata GSE-PSE-MK54-09C]|jgi:hypothetical protein|nr:Orange carotenoid protein [Kaiparowitsia implicata GSE-PSE-MK54-09C]